MKKSVIIQETVMKNIMKIVLLFILLSYFSVAACKKNDAQPGYGTIDPVRTVHSFAGKNRVKLTWKLPTNEQIKKCVIVWNGTKDSVIVRISSGTNTVSEIIDELQEGSYSFVIYAYDKHGNTSKKVTVKESVYGDRYEDSLKNRPVRSVNKSFSDNGETVIQWGDAAPHTVGTEVRYQDATGAFHDIFTEQFINKTDIKDYKRGNLLEYRTLYVPELHAIDTFYSAYDTIQIAGIPDYSFAGYEQNAKAIPLVSVKQTVVPASGDDGARIQQAIDAVSQMPLINGFRGTVLLKAGNYEVEHSLVIAAGGVVLRGEGQGENGTVITATGKKQYQLIQILGGGKAIESGRVDITGKVPVGSVKIPVTDASSFHVGDSIIVTKTPNQNWIQTLQMEQYGWTASGYKIGHRRVIKKITGDTLYVGIPMVDSWQPEYGGGYVTHYSWQGRIAHCGVENLRLKSDYSSDEDESHGWIGVSISSAVNCWVRNVTALYFGYACVGIYHSDFNTVQDCALLDPKSITTGGRKYSFYIDKGMGNLFQRCFTRGGRHDFVTGSRVTGPNVFLDCYATQTHSDIGPHHRWATGILFDNIYGGQIHVQNRGSYGSGHGWAGVQTMLWNCYGSDIIIQSPQIGQNWAVGCTGGSITGHGPFSDREGYIESWGTPVQPRSLFLNQLKKRLGTDAVDRITISAQRSGSVWNALKSWAGNEHPLEGL